MLILAVRPILPKKIDAVGGHGGVSEADRLKSLCMGYTHYWYRPRVIPDAIFRRIGGDFEKLIVPLSDAGIELAGGLGEGTPEITEDVVRFNGLNACGHPPTDELVIAYPSEHAHGIGPSSTAIDGSFYELGVTVKHRCCNGRCSFETFCLAKSREVGREETPETNGQYCDYIKTGFRPYDIAVTGVLLIAKHHLGDQFVVHSNGGDAQWSDARRICQQALGYGDWIGIIEEHIEEHWPAAGGSTVRREVLLRTLVEMEPPKLD